MNSDHIHILCKQIFLTKLTTSYLCKFIKRQSKIKLMDKEEPWVIPEHNFCINSIQILLSGSDKRFVQMIINQNFQGCYTNIAQQLKSSQYLDQKTQQQTNNNEFERYQHEIHEQNDLRQDRLSDNQQEQIIESQSIFVNDENSQFLAQQNQMDIALLENQLLDMPHNIEYPYPEQIQYQNQVHYSSSNQYSEDQDQNESNYSLQYAQPNHNQQQAFTIQIQGQEPPGFNLLQHVTDFFDYDANMFQYFSIYNDQRARGLSQNQINQIQQIEHAEQKMIQNQQKCSICIQVIKTGDKLMILKCKHKYHCDCLRTWLKDSCICPNCRHSLK